MLVVEDIGVLVVRWFFLIWALFMGSVALLINHQSINVMLSLVDFQKFRIEISRNYWGLLFNFLLIFVRTILMKLE